MSVKKLRDRAFSTIDKISERIDKPHLTTLEVEVALGIAVVAVVHDYIYGYCSSCVHADR